MSVFEVPGQMAVSGSSRTNIADYSGRRMRYNAIIIGGGHNGLTAAAYLARAGRTVLVLERRHLVGGAAVTEEVHPGFRFSVCSYLVSLLRPEIIRELDLSRRTGIASREARVRDDTEGRAADGRNAARLTEVGDVEQVEHLDAKLGPGPAPEVDVLDHRQVYVAESGADDRVARQVAEMEDAARRHRQCEH